jgi:hypothetical protein
VGTFSNSAFSTFDLSVMVLSFALPGALPQEPDPSRPVRGQGTGRKAGPVLSATTIFRAGCSLDKKKGRLSPPL